jgi:hypothetical protein
MNPQDRVTINKLPTGVPGLDEIVGGSVLSRFLFEVRHKDRSLPYLSSVQCFILFTILQLL